MDQRIEYYVNDKVQAYADFDTLDQLLDDLKTQQTLLQQQLVNANIEHRKVAQETCEAMNAVKQQAAEYARQQADVDGRLDAAFHSAIAPKVMDRLDPAVRKLHSLHLADGYLTTLDDVEQMSHNVKDDVETSLRAANDLYAAIASIKQRQKDADGAAPHFVDKLESIASKFRMDVHNMIADDLESTLQKILWPKPNISIPESLLPQFDDASGRLLSLQRPMIEAWEERQMMSKIYRPETLTLMQVLVQPLELRFAYHFSGDKPTNKADKPEYFLSHTLDLFSTYNDFVNVYVQPILLRNFAGSQLADGSGYLDATSALITAILSFVRAKALAASLEVRHHPQLLSHLLHELMQFDATLRNEWRYNPVPSVAAVSSSEWRGITHDVLSNENIFSDWLGIEKSFAIARYESIMTDANASQLDLDSTDTPCNRPTLAATRLHDLFTTITSLYRPLQSFTMKLRFLIDIQITLLDKFYDRLQYGLEAYLSMTSSLARAMQGTSSSELSDLSGVQRLDRVCRIFGSADFMERAMQSWGSETLFLEMWDELQARSKLGNSIGGDLDLNDVAKRTSSFLTSSSASQDVDLGTIFDETANVYSSLRQRSEILVRDELISSCKEILRSYTQSAGSWTALQNSEDDVSGISVDLAAVLSDYSSKLTLLRRILARPILKKLSKDLANETESFLIERLIYRNSFTARGAQQLAVDIVSLENAFEISLGSGINIRLFARLKDSITLLTLAKDASDDDVAGDVPKLDNVEARLFADNEEARAIMDELEIENITVHDARSIIRTRVELNADR